MSKKANVDFDIHELLRRRWSPYAFDPSRNVSEEDLRALFEAARWAMSSFNAQPWRYIVANKATDPALWDRVHGVLVEGNRPWAKNAPVLALGLVQHYFEHNNKPNKAAVHDLGAASAFLTFEATARALSVHQMIGIEPDKARQEFAIQDSLEPLTGIAIGYLGTPEVVSSEYSDRDEKARERKSLQEIIIHGEL